MKMDYCLIGKWVGTKKAKKNIENKSKQPSPLANYYFY
jgi:hypothetical protein